MNQKGFTLVELMASVAIMGILIMISVPNFIHYKNVSYNTRAQAILKAAIVAQEAHFNDWNIYADDIDYLSSEYNLPNNGAVLEIDEDYTDNHNYEMHAYHPHGTKTYIIIGPGGFINE